MNWYISYIPSTVYFKNENDFDASTTSWLIVGLSDADDVIEKSFAYSKLSFFPFVYI